MYFHRCNFESSHVHQGRSKLQKQPLYPKPGPAASSHCQRSHGGSLSNAANQGEDASELARGQVRYVMSDSPSVKVLQALKAVFPNLCGMALDPVRLAIGYEYAQWRKRTPSSKLLRDLLQNVVQHDSEKGHAVMGIYLWWSGVWPFIPPRGDMEQSNFKRDTHPGICPADDQQPRSQFASVHRRELHWSTCSHLRASHKKKPIAKSREWNKAVRHLLWTACSPSRLEWLFNNQRVRHSLAPHERCLLPSGTTSSEALRSQINSRTRSTHEVHRSTLKLKLQV